ncbi:class A beta-lactamase [Pseudoduganella aquatica]|uniref:class A beta-lactamase n=1 Tax=Pseudoduganella aquatica TaxID=2660641 RepID=UPI001E5B423D|nr:class A beta-lactamase [Pseudoduganella aquatica]
MQRRDFLGAAALAPFVSLDAFAADATVPAFAALEKDLGGRLGVAAINLSNGKQAGHRAGERFPLCSTFKAVLAAAILQRSASDPSLLQRRIHYTEKDLVPHAPITGERIAKGMTVEDLCAATVQYSDNPAANLLMKVLGGPEAVTAFARSVGDTEFRLDRWETELNTAIPGDPRDTTTPQAMMRSLQALVVGDALPAPQRQQLKEWLVGNTTGGKMIRAGTPAGWTVGDKTGGGAYGARNDIAVIWPPGKAPIVIAIYTAHGQEDAKYREDIIAGATRAAIALVAEA